MNAKMMIVWSLLAVGSAAGSTTKVNRMEKNMDPESKFYSFVVKTIDGKERSLSEYKGKVVLVVNVASKCGYTPQYAGLESLFEKYKDKGLMILGFPSNNFMWQEPGTDQEIKEFCSTKYNVTFDMFSKIDVKGGDQHPLYKYLTKESEIRKEVKWNFNKFLIDQNGTVVAYYPSSVEPNDPEIIKKIDSLTAVKR
jgi:glutathione peroxidase-family protein